MSMFGEPEITLPARRWLKTLGLSVVFATPFSAFLYELVAHSVLTARDMDQIVAWGPAIFVVGGCFVLADRWAPKILTAQHAGASAQQKLADAVSELVARGDRDSREAIGTMRYVVVKLERLDRRLDAIETKLGEPK